jgi:hypothetical protein
MTTPVKTSNTGLLDLYFMRVESFEIARFGVGPDFEIRYNVSAGYEPPNKILKAGESETVSFRSFVSMPSPNTVVDIALIASYRPAFIKFWRKRTAFRFRSVIQSDGKLRLEKQPTGDVLEQYDKSPHSSP